MLGQGRCYSVVASESAQTSQVDFLEINAPSDGIVILQELHLSQASEVGDAGEEMLLFHIKTGATTSGSGGSAPTAVPRELGSPAFGGTVETMNTTKATGGTIVTHESRHFNVRVPYDRVWVPGTYIIIPPSGRLTVELATTPADSITFGLTAIFTELG